MRDEVVSAPAEDELFAALLREVGVTPRRQHEISRRTDDSPPPASAAQRAFWLAERLAAVAGLYAMPGGMRLKGVLDASALEWALGETVRRHEVLRTTFQEGADGLVQMIHPAGGFRLPVEDRAHLPPAGREAWVARRAREEAVRPFRLDEGPLFRAVLLRLGAEEHVLLWNMHHIVSDGWSLGVFHRELAALYGARVRGLSPSLPDPRLQYGDYALWEREHHSATALAPALAAWVAALEGAPTRLELPADHQRPAVRSNRGGTHALSFAPGTGDALRALARREGTTPYAVLAAALGVFLARYTGEHNLIVGTPAAGRTQLETEEVIGPFVNLLPLRMRIEGDPTFLALVGTVSREVVGAQQRQAVPFERIVEALRLESSPAYAPLAQVVFSHRHDDGDAPGLPGLDAAPVEVGTGTAKYDLMVAFVDGPAGLRAVLEYATDLIEPATAARMAGHLRALVEGITVRPASRISELPLMDAEEHACVVEAWNGTAAPYPRDATIHELFARRVSEAPDHPAVAFRGETLTYRELDERANRLARLLLGRGVEPEARIGVWMERSADAIVALLAVLKAGGAYVPLDPAHPPARLAALLGGVGVRMVVSREAYATALPEGVDAVFLDRDAESLARESPAPPPVRVAADALAYVLFTSGSTGIPKGVAVSHRAVVRLVSGASWFSLSPDDTVLHLAPLAFDASTFELWGSLLNGSRLAVFPPDRAALDELTTFLAAEGVTTLWLTAGLFHRIVDEDPRAFRGVRQLIAGGDVLSPAHVRTVLEANPGLTVVNGYGPTEGTTFTCCHPVHALDREASSVPIGRPVSNTRAYVLDDALLPVPVGVPGGLYAGGDGLARGYFGDPALTAGSFVPAPFGAPGSRLYRTGDRARWRADGTLEFLGRGDAQVKVRGFRVEPGEVEEALRRHPAVVDAAVSVVPGSSGDRTLAAWIVQAPDAAFSPAELRAWASRRLPEYMVPSAFLPVDTLPLTPNGKVNRRALPEPRWEAAAGGDAPRTPTEEILAGVWSDVLGVERFGVHDSFFALGGHSLDAMQMMSRVREALSSGIPMRAFFEAPTVAGLAGRIDALRTPDGHPAPPLAHGVREAGEAPTSVAQRRLWFVHRLDPRSSAYNVPIALRLEGGLDAAALERSLGEIVRRHEALRTVFGEERGEPVQRILGAPSFAVGTRDLRILDPGEREREAVRLAGEEASRPFDLESDLPCRALLLRTGDDRHLLVWTMHHIACDAASIATLFRELEALYGAFSRGLPSPLPEPAFQYADYAEWQRKLLASGALHEQLSWWKERLDGAPELLEIPTDRPRPAVAGSRGGTHPFSLPSDAARALARHEGATFSMVVLAAFQVLLARYTGQGDICVGLPVAQRDRAELAPVVGFFGNTLVLRGDLSGDPSFRTLLARVRAAALDAYARQDLPFDRLVEELRPVRTRAHTPLFQVMLALQAPLSTPVALPGLRVTPESAGTGTAKYDLTLFVSDHAGDGDVPASLEYRLDLFDQSTIARVANHLRVLLEGIAAAPGLRISELPLLTEGERTSLLTEWSRSSPPVPGRQTIHTLFEAQARRTPDSPALVWNASTVSYRELDAEANRLARHLQRQGVRPESRVGICLERGPELVAAVLATLKAGGACVPLDPAYPRDRLALMLRDARASILVTGGEVADPGAGTVRTVRLDRDRAHVESECASTPDVKVDPANLAYVIYTSGSTGVPKGVAMPHGAFASLLAWQLRNWAAPGPRRTLQFTSLSFDVSFQEIFSTLGSGGALVLIDDETRRDPVQLLRFLSRQGVERLFLPYVALQSIAEAAHDGGARPVSLREVITAGEQLRVSPQITRFFGGIPGCTLHNQYGPAETHVVTAHALGGRPSEWPALPPIGAPVDNACVYVLDAMRNPVPVGVVGEVYLGGASLARGYLDRPALTAERFVPDPFGGRGERLYRTGDRACWRNGAVLEFLGRVDRQVKVRGFRVEPGEVEAALARRPGIRDCAVILSDADAGARRLVAYLVASPEAPLDTKGLRQSLADELPEYMVPSAFVALDALPLTPSGKVDRGALPAPDASGAAETYVAPRTETEAAVAAIWAEVFEVEKVGAEDSFFDLGGHSLLATLVVARIRSTYGVEIPLYALFREPTVAGLAREVEERRRTAPPPARPEIAPIARGGYWIDLDADDG
jgi:amino acid adenylation domain-containing protein